MERRRWGSQYGDTPMHTSARYGHAGVMRILISADCHVSEQNKVKPRRNKKKKKKNAFYWNLIHWFTEWRYSTAHSSCYGPEETDEDPAECWLLAQCQKQSEFHLFLGITVYETRLRNERVTKYKTDEWRHCLIMQQGEYAIDIARRKELLEIVAMLEKPGAQQAVNGHGHHHHHSRNNSKNRSSKQQAGGKGTTGKSSSSKREKTDSAASSSNSANNKNHHHHANKSERKRVSENLF